MNNKSLSILVSVVLAVAAAPLSASANNKQHAADVCKHKIKSHNRYSNIRNMVANRVSSGNFNVTGLVHDSNDKHDHQFTCKVRHGELTSWNVSTSHDVTAKEVGAGLLALAVVAAVANEADKNREQDRGKYASGRHNPFKDMTYLRQECNHELRKHLGHDHGKVQELRLRKADLKGRELSGHGRVIFNKGTRHHLKYTCHFDRRGRIHDGNYQYTN